MHLQPSTSGRHAELTTSSLCRVHHRLTKQYTRGVTRKSTQRALMIAVYKATKRIRPWQLYLARDAVSSWIRIEMQRGHSPTGSSANHPGKTSNNVGYTPPLQHLFPHCYPGRSCLPHAAPAQVSAASMALQCCLLITSAHSSAQD
jgi:hypothetical protein